VYARSGGNDNSYTACSDNWEIVLSTSLLVLAVFVIGLFLGSIAGNRGLREQNELLRRQLYEIEGLYTSSSGSSAAAVVLVLMFLGLVFLYLMS
jgi:hypothetical protein